MILFYRVREGNWHYSALNVNTQSFVNNVSGLVMLRHQAVTCVGTLWNESVRGSVLAVFVVTIFEQHQHTGLFKLTGSPFSLGLKPKYSHTWDMEFGFETNSIWYYFLWKQSCVRSSTLPSSKPHSLSPSASLCLCVGEKYTMHPPPSSAPPTCVNQRHRRGEQRESELQWAL